MFVVLGLGSNSNFNGMSPVEILNCAFDEIRNVLTSVSVSSVYKTKPMYVTDQNYFYNACLSGYIEDSVSPFELLKKVNEIEAKYGRNRSNEIRNGPRTLDIDIEIMGNLEINEENLQVPHPRLKERAFVLIPMLEILEKSADSINRELLKKISEMKKNVDEKDVLIIGR